MYSKQIVENINRCTNIIDDNNREMDKLQFINKITEAQLVLEIRKLTVYNFEWDKINRFISGEGENVNKNSYEALVYILVPLLTKECNKFNKRRFIDEIVFCGREVYGYNIYFTVNNTQFYLFYPEYKKIDIGNYKSAHCGKFALSYKVSESHYKMITESYDIVEIGDRLQEFLKEKQNG